MNSSKVPAGQKVSFVRRHRTFFAGLFVLIPAVALPVLLVFTLMKADFIQGWCHLYVIGDNAYGLSKGSPVTVSGMAIGHVEKVNLIREGMVEVQFNISREHQHLVKKDTQARFQQKSPVVGEWIIELTGGTDTVAVVADYDTLKPILPFRFDKTIQQVTGMVESIAGLIDGISRGQGTVGQLLVGDSISGLVQGVGGNVNGLIGSVGVTLQNVDTLIKELTTLSRTGNGMIDSFAFVSAEVRLMLGNVTEILDNVRSASTDVQPLLDQVQNEISEADRMMKTLQQSWIYRTMDGKRTDPILKGTP